MIGVCLAAGRGTRMKSARPKVLFDVNDEPLGFASVRAAMEACDDVCVVVGYKGDDVRAALESRAVEVFGAAKVKSSLRFAVQDPPRGTGDAVRVALESLGKKASNDDILVINGDLPLIRAVTLKKLKAAAHELKLDAACLSMRVAKPAGLGRILRDDQGRFVGIREEKDCSKDEKAIREVNGGLYFFKGALLAQALKHLKTNNAQGEFYLTDLLDGKDRTRRAEALGIKSPWDLQGVNTTYELATARKVAQARLQRRLCEDFGVDFEDPTTAYVSARATFKGSCRVGPGTVIRGATTIGTDVLLEGQNFIENAVIEDGAQVKWGSVIESSTLRVGAQVGPYARVRPESDVGPNAKVGNFVELKKTKLGAGAKASHLTYLGDADVGAEANIGCGTITCNYDGHAKHKTVIGQGAFIGSDSQLVAPVVIGDGAYVASGTTVTKDVPAGALALSRVPMVVKDGYAVRLNQRHKARKAAQKK